MPLHRFLSTTSTGSPRAWDIGYLFYDPPQGDRWDLSTAAIGQIFSVSSEDTTPVNVSFKPDGTKMYVLGQTGDDVNEYSLSRAWDLSSASYVQNYSIIAQDSQMYGLFLSDDGTRMYCSGATNDAVYQYSLSTAWDISSASFVQNYVVSSQSAIPRDVFLKPDGTKMYVLGYSTNNVYEYSLSTAWDISSASYVQSVAANGTGSLGLAFSPDGDKMYILETGVDGIDEFTLSTPWDISTATFATAFNSLIDTSPYGLYAKQDGSALYYVGGYSDVVRHLSLGSFSVSSEEISPYGISFKPDGTKMYITGPSGDDINEYNLSTAWDTSSAVYSQNFSLAAQDSNIAGHYFKDDGTRLFVAGSTADAIYEYNLSTPWDVSTITFDQSFSVAGQETNPRGVHFSPDGTKMYVIGLTGDDVNEYTLTTGWEMTTASFVQSFSVSTQETSLMSVFFKPDGTRMFVTGYTNDKIHQYDLTAAWDVSTASYSKTAPLSTTNVSGMFFKPNGLGLFVLGFNSDEVQTYTLGQQP